MATPDIVVIGAGPNGLFAACRLARAGVRVLVVEARPDRPGGALATVETTRPGYRHDVGAGFVAFRDSVAFQALDLARHGLSWRFGTFESCHPAPDDSVAAISRDLERTVRHFGSDGDGDAWRKLSALHARVEPELLAYMGPFPQIRPALRMRPLDAFRVLRIFASTPAGFANRTFTSGAARRVFPGMTMHVDVGPHDRFGCGLGYMLCLRASTAGFAIPEGGAGAITSALVNELEALGGAVRLGARVDRVVVRGGRARSVVLSDGTEIEAPRGVVADTSAPSLYLRLLTEDVVPGWIRRRMRVFPMGWGTFKVDFALSAPVPWRLEACCQSAVVHAGDSVDDLARHVAEVRSGVLPTNPYLVIGQHSLFDSLRAPPGGHTLYVYGRVPARPEGGWAQHAEAFADRIVDRIEGMAPGFRATVLERAIHTPVDLEQMDANLIDGDLGGGSNAWHRQLVFRPVFPYFRYRTPVRRLYLCSMYTHPGTGIHGMCGWNAAGMVLKDLSSGR